MEERTLLVGFAGALLVCLMDTCVLQAMKAESPKKEKEAQLISACLHGDLAEVEKLVQEGVDLNVRNEHGNTPLKVSAAFGYADIVDCLLQTHKVDIDAKDNSGVTALHFAIQAGKIKIVKMLLKAGANVERGVYVRKLFPSCSPEIKSFINTKLNEIYTPIRCKYRNLIIIVNDGSEWLAEQKNSSMLTDFSNALAAECAFILIPSEFWDYFLHAHYQEKDAVTENPITIDTKKLFDQIKDRWEVYKISTLVKTEKPQEEDSAEDFYIFCPVAYKELLTLDPNKPSVKLKDIKLKDINNDCLDLGLDLLEKIAPDKLTQQTELGKLFDENERYLQEKNGILEKMDANKKLQILTAQEIQDMKSKLNNLQPKLKNVEDYITKRNRSINKNFIACLDKLLVFPRAKKELAALNSLIELPQYNVYISGHGGSTEPSPEFEALMARWSSKGYVAPREIAQLKGKVSQQLMEEGYIAGLPANVFGKALERFNGVANSLFVSTCHGGGLHLILPFVFMTSPPLLSYTLINNSLIDAQTYSVSLLITMDAGKYKLKPFMLFQDYFDGISDFTHFVKNKADTPNSFSQLLNYVGKFLDFEGTIKNVQNIPWIKLPGPTNWQMVSYLDSHVLVITDVMMKAKRFEHEVQEGQKKSVGDVLKEKLKKIKLPEARVSPQFIDASQKKFIFVATNNVDLEVKFGKTTETKAIIPIMPTTGFSNVMMFKTVQSDDTFADFFDKILKPKEPLFKMPQRTVIFIKELICADVSYKNFILPFDIPELGLDFYYLEKGTTCGIRIGAPSEKIQLENVLLNAIFDKKVWLADILLKVGANPDYSSVGRDSNTPLMVAALKNEIEIVKLLIAAQADVNKKNKNGLTALNVAVIFGLTDIVRLLLQAGADAMLLPRPDALAEITRKSEIWKLLTKAMRQSPTFKKELQMLQQKIAAGVWNGGKIDDVIKRHMPEFKTRLSAALA